MSLITEEKLSLFHSYASEFEKRYLLEPAGQKHLALYKKERDDVTQFWTEIKRFKRAGKQITDLVLHKLLPYSNTRHNREMNYRISVAPAITKDLVKRPTPSAKELTSDERIYGGKILKELIYKVKPQVICSIYKKALSELVKPK